MSKDANDPSPTEAEDWASWLREGLDLLDESVLIVGSDGQLTFANRAACRRAGTLDHHGLTLEQVARRLATAREVAPLPPTALDALSRREREVLRAFLDGFGSETIAQQLDLAPSTVRNHLKNAQRKLGVRSQIALRELFARTL